MPRVHDHDVVGQLGHHPQVVGDDDDRRVELLLQVQDQIQDLGLHGDVQGRGGLVGDEQLGVAGQGHRDHGPLAHAARELVRVIVDPGARLRDADPAQQVDGALAGHGARHVVVHPVGLDDLVAHRVVRVQGGQRILEDHGHLAAAQLAHLVRVDADQLPAAQPDLAADLRVLTLQTHDGQAGHGLARAGLPDDAESLALVQAVGDPIDRLDQAVVGREVDAQIPDLKQFAIGHQ